MSDEVFLVLKKIASEHGVNINKNQLNSDFKEIGIDSLLGITIIVEIEKSFGVRLNDDILMKLKTPNDIIKEISKLLNEK